MRIWNPTATYDTHTLRAKVKALTTRLRKRFLISSCKMLLGVIALSWLSSCSTVTTVSGWLGILETGDKSKAIDNEKVTRFFSTVQASKGNPDSHYLLARYYQQTGMLDQAVIEYTKTILIDRTFVKAYNALGVICDQRGEHLKAIEHYKQALKLDPNLDYVQNNLGYSYLLQGKYDESIVALKEAVALNKGSKRTHNNLGLAYAMNGLVDLALAEFIQTDNDGTAHANVASILYKKGLFHQAKLHYALALAIDPDLINVPAALRASEAMAKISALTNDEKGVSQPVLLDKTSLGWVPQAEIQSGDSSVVRSDSNEMAKAGVEISNGNGVRQMAGKIASALSANGVKVVRLTNAKHFNYLTSEIFYQKDYRDAAVKVASNMPSIRTIAPMSEPERRDVKVKVIIGRDLISGVTATIQENN